MFATRLTGWSSRLAVLPTRRCLRVPDVRHLEYKADWSHKQIEAIPCQLRTSDRKWDNRRLRDEGKITGLVFGDRPDDKVLVQFNEEDLTIPANDEAFQCSIYELQVFEDDARTNLLLKQNVLAKTVDWNPKKNVPYDITFQKWSPGKKVRVEIPLVIFGEEYNLALRRGAMIDYKMRRFDAIWRGDHHIPSYLQFDVEELDYGEKVYLGDLEIPDGLVITKLPKNYCLLKIKGREDGGADADEDDDGRRKQQGGGATKEKEATGEGGDE
jgi:large subunit ribosomal protein L25